MAPVGIHLAGGFDPDQDPFSPFARRLSEEERQHLQSRSGLKHARLLGATASFAMLAGRKLQSKMHSNHLGVICTGGPSNLSASTEFVERSRLAGAALVNPLQFPGTLSSAAATAVASALEAHGFAFGVGYDRLAFFEALEQAASILATPGAPEVMVLAAVGNDKAVEQYRARAQLSRSILDVSIGFGLTSHTDGTALQLLDIQLGNTLATPGVPTYSAQWTEDTFACDFAPPLNEHEALGASGALICIAALQHHLTRGPLAHSPFAVSVRSDAKTATVVLQARD